MPLQRETPRAGGAGQEVGARQPDGRGPARVTSIRRALLIGALFALVAAGASSLATARLTDRQADFDQLTSQMSQQEAQIARLASQAGEGADEVDRLKAETAILEDQVRALEADKASLEEQISQFLNPAPGPTPTVRLNAIWVAHQCTGCSEIVVCAEVENTSESAVDVYYSYSQFSAVDADNFVYPPRLHTPGYGIQLRTPLLDGPLSPGEKRRGQLLYDVPVQADYTTANLARLVWHVGFAGTPAIAVDLPSAQGSYSTFGSSC